MASTLNYFRGLDLEDSFIASDKLPYHFVIFFAFLLLTCYATRTRPKFPVLNPKTTTADFMRKSKDLFVTGRSTFGARPYIMRTYLGDAIVLPPQMMNEVRNLDELDFWAAIEADHHGHLRGFEAFKANYDGATMINRHLTKALGKHTRSLYQEAKLAIHDLFTDSKDWHEIQPSRELMMLVARVSTRLFLGTELCRDQNWIRLTSGYTHVVFQAVQALRQFPPSLRPFANRLLPICSKTRTALQACRDYLQPIILARQARKNEAAARGVPEPVYNDAIEWCKQEYSSDRDPADSQISLAMVAIHPTTDLLTETMVQIARHPELFKPLREEVVKVLGSEGLKKTALYNLTLLDSVIKESQRLKPASVSNFRRVVVKDITLSNGIRLQKGELVWIDNAHMWTSAYWESAEQFDAYRFVKLRGTEKEHTAHLVTTSPEHLGFGHGRQACPGRFAAAHEIKILLSYLLMTYDWKLPEGHDPPSIAHGMNLMPDPSTKLLIRRREEELDFESLHIEDD